jgi:hypothetical protein
VECCKDGPAGDLNHFADGECHVAAGLASRRIDEAEVGAVTEQTDRQFGFAQKPLELGMGSGLPVTVVLDCHFVKIRSTREALDEHQPRGLRVFRLELAHRMRWPKRLMVFR